MNKILYILFVLAICSAINTVYAINLIPQPNKVEIKKQTLNVGKEFQILVSGISDTEIEEFLVSKINYVNNVDKAATKKNRIVLNFLAKSEGIESYSLNINQSGIQINSNHKVGMLYGIMTLNQLLYQSQIESGFSLPYLVVSDEPAYEYRGFMLDASRHMQEVSTVKSILDFMCSVKLNVFHWHLTDDEGWRIESDLYPNLNIVGSNMINTHFDNRFTQVNGYYTKEEIREICEYAAQLNIEVIPEIDVPGHNFALTTAYPELRCPGHPASNAVCGADEKNFMMLTSLFGELLEIYPFKRCHIGGDERKPGIWKNCEVCNTKMTELGLSDEKDLQNYFLNKISGHIHAKGVTTVAWAEHLEGDIPEGQITQAWRRPNEAELAAQQGHHVIVSDNPTCYLDYPANEEIAKTKPDWMTLLPTEMLYNFDFRDKELTASQKQLIIGGECPLWTELVHQEEIYSQIGERIEAHAERSWTNINNKSYQRYMQDYKELSDLFKSFFSTIKPY